MPSVIIVLSVSMSSIVVLSVLKLSVLTLVVIKQSVLWLLFKCHNADYHLAHYHFA
jgi:hypothetical protein